MYKNLTWFTVLLLSKLRLLIIGAYLTHVIFITIALSFVPKGCLLIKAATNPTVRNYYFFFDFFKINFNQLSTILNPMTKVISNGKSFPIWEDIKGLYPQMGTLMRLLQCTALIEQCSLRLFKKIGFFKYCICHSTYKPESNKNISHWIRLKLIV